MAEKNIVEKKNLNYTVEEGKQEEFISEEIDGETFEESEEDKQIIGLKPEPITHPDIPPLEKKPKKQKIIDDIILLSEKMNIQCDTRNKLNKTTVGNLEKKLAELVNTSLKNNLDEHLIKKNVDRNNNAVVNNNDKVNVTSSIPDDLVADSLYNINFLMINTIENITCSFDLPVNLQGLTKKMDMEKKEELKKILVRIVGDYSEVIKPLMSPISMYVYTMLILCQQTITDNLKKKSIE